MVVDGLVCFLLLLLVHSPTMAARPPPLPSDSAEETLDLLHQFSPSSLPKSSQTPLVVLSPAELNQLDQDDNDDDDAGTTRFEQISDTFLWTVPFLFLFSLLSVDVPSFPRRPRPRPSLFSSSHPSAETTQCTPNTAKSSPSSPLSSRASSTSSPPSSSSTSSPSPPSFRPCTSNRSSSSSPSSQEAR